MLQFAEFVAMLQREYKQKRFFLVRNYRFALAIVKFHKKSVSLSFDKILACFDFSETCIRQQNFFVCLTKNLVNFFVNYRSAPQLEYSYSFSKPSVLGKYSYSLGCVLGTRLKKQSSTRVLCLMAKQVEGQH